MFHVVFNDLKNKTCWIKSFVLLYIIITSFYLYRIFLQIKILKIKSLIFL